MKYLAGSVVLVVLAMGFVGYAMAQDDEVYVPPNQFATSDLDEVSRDSSAFDGGSGSTSNTSSPAPVEAYGSSVPDIGPAGPVDTN